MHREKMNGAKSRSALRIAVALGLMALLTLSVARAAPVHGIALHGQPKYGADFGHFDYVNPAAPKGGEARFAAIGSFDTFNPFNINGEKAADIGQLFETLMTGSADEPFSEYGLIAESVEVPEDRSSVTFTLRPQAKFHDGSPITADDVLFSFAILKSKGTPFYRMYYASIAKAEKLGAGQVQLYPRRESRAAADHGANAGAVEKILGEPGFCRDHPGCAARQRSIPGRAL
jgi:microcin C transport system substrate-binding protein